MTTAPKLTAVPSSAPVRAESGSWRADLDPVSLPASDHLSLGQRKVLLACLETFADKGFGGSSVRDIAAAAGMQSASLYNHFPSKDAMLLELVKIGYETYMDRLMEAVLNAPSDPREQLVAVVQTHVLVHCQHPKLGLVVTYEAKHLPAELSGPLRSYPERTLAMTAEILRRGAEQGVFDVLTPHVTLLAFGSMGVDSARWYPYQETIGMDELARDYAQLALRMVGAS